MNTKGNRNKCRTGYKTCKNCGKEMSISSGSWIHMDTGVAGCNGPTFRNYNVGRDIDDRTGEFEQKLNDLINEYSCYVLTESF